MNYKTFKLDYRPEGNIFPGVYVFIEKGVLCEKVKAAFGREDQDLCLKIFRQLPFTGKVEDYRWGSVFCREEHRTRLLDATKAQNIAAWHGLAPRVYAIVIIEYRGFKFLAQLTDYLGGEPTKRVCVKEETYQKVKKVLFDYGFLPPIVDLGPDNVIDKQWLDFQGAKPKDDYRIRLISKVEKSAYFVKGTHYQDQPELKLAGFRKSGQRIKDLQLQKINFNDRSVLDVGSCGGFFCNYAAKNGAKRVVGVDIPRNAEIARELSNFLGYFNVDYVGKEIKKDEKIKEFAGLKNFGIVLYLAVNWYLGFPEWCFEMTKDIMIVEKNGKEDQIRNETVEKILKNKFTLVEMIGRRTDFDNQPIFKCQK